MQRARVDVSVKDAKWSVCVRTTLAATRWVDGVPALLAGTDTTAGKVTVLEKQSLSLQISPNISYWSWRERCNHDLISDSKRCPKCVWSWYFCLQLVIQVTGEWTVRKAATVGTEMAAVTLWRASATVRLVTLEHTAIRVCCLFVCYATTVFQFPFNLNILCVEFEHSIVLVCWKILNDDERTKISCNHLNSPLT